MKSMKSVDINFQGKSVFYLIEQQIILVYCNRIKTRCL